MQNIWEKGRGAKDWQNAVVIPIPKKGDLLKCDNWRGISLLEVSGKVFARRDKWKNITHHIQS